MMSRHLLANLKELKEDFQHSEDEDDQLVAMLLQKIVESNQTGSLRELADEFFNFAYYDKTRKRHKP